MWQALHDMNDQALKINYCRPSTSSLADYTVDPSAERQSQDTSSLPVQSFKETVEETGELNEPSTSITMGFDTNSTAECQNQESSKLPVQSFKQTRKETSALDKPSTSSAADYSMDPTAERQSGELSGLPVQSLKEMAEETGALDKPSTSSSMDYNTNSAAECQSQEIVDLDPQTCEQSRKGTRARDGPSTSITTGFDTNPTAECQSQETIDLDPQTCEQSQKETRARIGPSTSSLTDNTMDPSAERQNQDTSGLPVQSFKEKTGAFNVTLSSTSHDKDPNLERQIQEIVDFVLRSEQSRKETRALDGPNTSISMGIDTNSAAECQIQESPGLPVQLFGQTRKEISAFDKPSTSSSADYSMDPTAERQSGELSGLPVQSFKKMAEETGALDKPSTSSLADYSVDSSAERQSQDTSSLPVQSFKETAEETGAFNDTSITTGFDTNPNAVCQSQEKVDLDPQTCERSKKEKAHIGTVMTSIKKWSKLWNYFEELKRSLLKCTTCKKEIKVSHQTNCTKKMRAHLFNVHGISLDDDTLTLPDDLKHYYSKLPGYKAKCKDCGKTVSFLTNVATLRVHLRKRHSIKIQSQNKPSTSSLADNGMDPSAERQSQDTSGLPVQSFKETAEETGKLNEPSTSSLADYSVDPIAERQSEELSNLPVQSFKETTEKTGTLDEPSTSSSWDYNTNFAAECQSQEIVDLDLQTCEHSRKGTRARDGKVTAPRRKCSKLWNYFEELKPSLVKCTTCKKKIEIYGLTNRIKTMRRHLLNKHRIFLDDDTLTLPDDLKQYYSELPGYKAKCKNCGKTLSFLTNTGYLRKHLRKHSIRILSRDEKGSRKKRSKFWNYFEELKPSLVKCTTCKKEIKVLHLKERTRIMRVHLLNKHGIFLDDDTVTLPDDLRQYYSVLPGYKAKCKKCGKTVSFLKHMRNLQEHLRRRHSIRIQSRNKSSTLSLADNGMDLSAERQSQDISGLPVQSFKETTEKIGVLNESSTANSMDCNMNPSAERQSQKTVDLGPQTCEQSRKETRACDRSVIMAPKRKRSLLWNYFEQLKPSLVKCAICKMEIYMPHPSNNTAIMIGHLNRHGIFFNNDTYTLPDDLREYYSELPGYNAKCNDCSKTMSFLTNIVRLRKHLRRHSTRILSRDE
ncbi:uncharacterized protein LOC112461908 [Temnothorax curvispinosus]|uniref:Uncharacterized protein LOC112461908 n=1 Tax=Temnothorax curvispinosus TaxID=300111 RepID=A0A6J1QKY9_9HYME|nr:uncharacterized protein LOC112461908 [Temnothorax curvispinosus]